MDIIMYTDGASRSNPGRASIGVSVCVLLNNNESELYSISEYLGNPITNNVAEYTAILRGLQFLRDSIIPVSTLTIRTDSQLLVKQMNKQYKTSSPELFSLQTQIRELLSSAQEWTLQHIYRDANKRADQLCNQALDYI